MRWALVRRRTASRRGRGGPSLGRDRAGAGAARRRGGTWFVCRVAYGRYPRGSTDAAPVRNPAGVRATVQVTRSARVVVDAIVLGCLDLRRRDRCGRPPDRSRCGRATRRRAGDAGADPRRGRGCGRCVPGDAPRPPDPATDRHLAVVRRHSGGGLATLARARGRSSRRSTPFSPSSWRIARSPRGRARSRDSTQARANASSSSIPSSSRRVMAPSTRSARSRPRSAVAGPPRPSVRAAPGTARPPRARRPGRRSAARRSRRSANDAPARGAAAGVTSASPVTRPLRCPRPGSARRRSWPGSGRRSPWRWPGWP